MMYPPTLTPEGRAPAHVPPKEDDVHHTRTPSNFYLLKDFMSGTAKLLYCQGAARVPRTLIIRQNDDANSPPV